MSPLVLCYHAISSTWPCSLAMPEVAIQRHLAYLARKGYVGLTVTQAERRRLEGTLPQRTVVITFDDAYASTCRAKPLLDACGYPATVFAVSRFAESGSPLSWVGIGQWQDGPHAHELAALDWDGLRSLAEAGWEIGSHTVTHPRLPDIDDGSLATELLTSRTAIIEQIGSCTSIAYPYGAADTRVARAAAAAGYDVGFTLTSSHVRNEPLLRPRVGLYPTDGWRLPFKLSPAVGAIRRSRAGGWLTEIIARD